MTVGTNALLEGRTARTALIATEGFTDIEELGRQARADLYRLCAARPPRSSPPTTASRPLSAAVPTASCASSTPSSCASGSRRRSGVESVAVCLLWGFLHPEHERAWRARGRGPPGAHVSTSHETAAVFREYERSATTVVDAAVSPLLRRYLGRLTERARTPACPDRRSCCRAAAWSTPPPRPSTAPGRCSPAPRAAPWRPRERPRGAGSARRVGLDMGGTSCDVSLILDGDVAVRRARDRRPRAGAADDRHPHRRRRRRVDRLGRRGGALRVGPRSAGARPGPACYGLGGDRADGDRREPPARPARRRAPARGRRGARPWGGRARRRRARRRARTCPSRNRGRHPPRSRRPRWRRPSES